MNTIAPAHEPLTIEQTTDRTPSTARAYVAYILGELGISAAVIDDVTQRALVIANELTTNVYAHASGRMELDVALAEDGGSVVITVTDHAGGVPELGLPDVDLLAEHGYGLYLTAALADSVFEYPTADGKTIGAVIDLPLAVFDTMSDLLRDLDVEAAAVCETVERAELEAARPVDTATVHAPGSRYYGRGGYVLGRDGAGYLVALFGERRGAAPLHFEESEVKVTQESDDLSVEFEGWDLAYVIHDLDGTDSGACAADCSGCALELTGIEASR